MSVSFSCRQPDAGLIVSGPLMRKIHVLSHMRRRRIHVLSHMRRKIHVLSHMRRRIHTCRWIDRFRSSGTLRCSRKSDALRVCVCV
jgi:hypothetical protein